MLIDKNMCQLLNRLDALVANFFMAFGKCGCIILYMQPRIDSLGRMLTPKRLRSQLGLEPNTLLDIRQHEGGLLLKQHVTSDLVTDEGGVLVFHGQAVGELNHGINPMREVRLDALGATEPSEEPNKL